MKVQVTNSFDTDDLDKYVHVDDLAKQKMSAYIAREFDGAEYDFPTFTHIATHGDAEVRVTAEVEMTDDYWLLQNTDGWRDMVRSHKSEDIETTVIKPKPHGILVRGEVIVKVQEGDRSYEEIETEARRDARAILRGSLGGFADEDLGRVIGENGYYRVRFVVVSSYSTSAIASDVTRAQGRTYSPSMDWEEFATIV